LHRRHTLGDDLMNRSITFSLGGLILLIIVVAIIF
jgi:hypothetical protein